MVNNKLYFNDNNPGSYPEGKIPRNILDGSNIEILVTDLHVPRGIALGLLHEKNRLQRANFNGTDVENLVTEGLITPWYIDLTIEADIDGEGIPDSQDECPKHNKRTCSFARFSDKSFCRHRQRQYL